MPPTDYAVEHQQLYVPDHVAGPLDLKLNDKESPFPVNNLFSILQDPVEFGEQEDCADDVGFGRFGFAWFGRFGYDDVAVATVLHSRPEGFLFSPGSNSLPFWISIRYCWIGLLANFARMPEGFFLLRMGLKADFDCNLRDIDWFLAGVEERLVWTAVVAYLKLDRFFLLGCVQMPIWYTAVLLCLPWNSGLVGLPDVA
ncbi:hypothetical protein Nepgr_028939 [Nepenthes gracilis]|uniref:Uncharacterized protein n=1 Tax=Nepenthes gracilis TaxID=150966 RepID=A0AAD3TDY7_NEPGR|nr:hypothetical protein Nepgr_028939 [Nepenthes gracilis]